MNVNINPETPLTKKALVNEARKIWEKNNYKMNEKIEFQNINDQEVKDDDDIGLMEIPRGSLRRCL